MLQKKTKEDKHKNDNYETDLFDKITNQDHDKNQLCNTISLKFNVGKVTTLNYEDWRCLLIKIMSAWKSRYNQLNPFTAKVNQQPTKIKPTIPTQTVMSCH